MRAKFLKFFLYAALVLIISVLVIDLFPGTFIKFYCNTLTDYSINYKKWKGTLLTSNVVEGLGVNLKKEDLSLEAKTALISFNSLGSFKKSKLIFNFQFNNVKFLVKNKKAENGVLGKGNFLSVPFSSGWEYDEIKFDVEASPISFSVKNIDAKAKQVEITGDYVYKIVTKKMHLNLDVSFSPETMDQYLGEYKNMLFAPNEKGWYTSNILLEGTKDKPRLAIQSDMFQMNVKGE